MNELRPILERQVDPRHDLVKFLIQRHMILSRRQNTCMRTDTNRTLHGTKYVGSAPLEVCGGPGLTANELGGTTGLRNHSPHEVRGDHARFACSLPHLYVELG